MVKLQLLVFDSTKKSVVLSSGFGVGDELVSFKDVSTVRILEGYYEVIQIQGEQKVPVLRVPISNTNMLIQK
jgi:hypothetical protein